jgi:ABC-type transport system involved in cytochrome c biogenesis permease subunit
VQRVRPGLCNYALLHLSWLFAAFVFLFYTAGTLILQHLATSAPIGALLQKLFLSTGAMVSPYYLPSRASPELNIEA